MIIKFLPPGCLVVQSMKWPVQCPQFWNILHADNRGQLTYLEAYVHCSTSFFFLLEGSLLFFKEELFQQVHVYLPCPVAISLSVAAPDPEIVRGPVGFAS
jgi:hypothetical protein